MSEKKGWRCPSNIALVKYWGKKENQLPCNASLSLTLQNAFTEVIITPEEKKEKGIELTYFFEGKENEKFRARIAGYLEKNREYFPVLNDQAVIIESKNSFPHSAGIASSASAFGAIALALLSASDYQGKEFFRRASFLSRLGSGSACRSMFGGYALWGHLDTVQESSDEWALPLSEVHQNFSDMRDAILIVEDEPKKISSTVGHGLMKGHPYASTRFEQANEHCVRLLDVLKTGDYQDFITIFEREALALHAMMMTSDDYYLLMKPYTVQAISTVMEFRKDTGIPVGFTLDAGPNVHVIYPGAYEAEVNAFLNDHLQPQLKGIIFDRIGKGPEKISC